MASANSISRDISEVGDGHGRLLFDRSDVERGIDFHREMMRRFEKELLVLTKGEGV